VRAEFGNLNWEDQNDPVPTFADLMCMTVQEQLLEVKMRYNKYKDLRPKLLSTASWRRLLILRSIVTCLDVHCDGDADEFEERFLDFYAGQFHKMCRGSTSRPCSYSIFFDKIHSNKPSTLISGAYHPKPWFWAGFGVLVTKSCSKLGQALIAHRKTHIAKEITGI